MAFDTIKKIFGIKNVAGTQINPATEETLDLKLDESVFTDRIGEVQGSPTVNTLLGRLKSVEDKLSALQTELEQKYEGGAISATVNTITGYALEATLLLIKAKTDNLDAALSTIATAANQTTIIGHVDGIESALTTIQGYIDQIEGYVDGIETILGTSADASSPTGSVHAKLRSIATALEIMDDWDNAASDGASVSGDVAHDTADAGEPVKIGFKAIAHGTNPTAVTANDRTNAYANRHGIPFMLGGHPNLVTISASYTTTQTNAAVITAGAGTKIVIMGISVFADGGGTGPMDVQVGFGTATITSTKAIIDHAGIVKGSGVTLGFGAGMIAIGADDEDLRITAAGFGSGDELTISVLYFTIES